MDNPAALFTLAPGLASIVKPGVLWWSGATVGTPEHRLDSLLAEAEAPVRVTPPDAFRGGRSRRGIFSQALSP